MSAITTDMTFQDGRHYINGDMTSNGSHSPVEEANNKLVRRRRSISDDSPQRAHVAPSSTLQPSHAKHMPIGGVGNVNATGLADFFSLEVFQIVLHNPTTAHQMLKFSQSRMCGEHMEFLDKVDRYNALLDELTTTMSDIHRLFTSPQASKQLSFGDAMMRQINTDIKNSTTSTLPAMELIFAGGQEYVEQVLANEIYPRFVKHQMTLSATQALASDRGKYAGLGDCFCLTEPAKADNPITFASDGFLKVTGYSRSEVIPRNCRFLQGNYTDKDATRRLKASVDDREETVELLLNYRKNGEPFWNLLYVAPLFDSQGKLVFYIGGQINCSTTIHSCSDILRILSLSSDDAKDKEDPGDVASVQSMRTQKPKMGFFRSFLNNNANNARKLEVRDAGMEQGLLNRIEKMKLKTQMEMFYTAYSKYLVIRYSDFSIQFYSIGIIDTLGLTTRNSLDFIGSDIFKFLSQHTSTLSRDFKSRVKESLKRGQAISSPINLFTLRSLTRRVDDKFFTHWTPLKDEAGAVKWIVLTLSSTLYD